ncbi:hypothetical protein RKD55_003087 [Rossellomorea marisflavi]
MNEVDKKLRKEAENMQQIQPPQDLEARLRSALNDRPRKKRNGWKVALAAAAVLMILGSFQYPALAYYGKKIMGAEDVMNGTLHDLNEAGMGQVIDRTYALGEGEKITIDGVIVDENQFILYYTLHNANGVEEGESWEPGDLTGFLTREYMISAKTVVSDDRTELKGEIRYDPPNAFAKELILHVDHYKNDEWLEGEKFTFNYRPDQALQTNFKQGINKTVTFDNGSITFKSITASPTITVIKGKMKLDEEINDPLGEIELVADGKVLEWQGSGSSSNWGLSDDIELEFDALPHDLNKLELVVKAFPVKEKADITVPLSPSKTFKVMDQNVMVKKSGVKDGQSFVTIESKEGLRLDGVSIKTESGTVKLDHTTDDEYTKKDGEAFHERTLLFETKDEPQSLIVKGISYMKTYDQHIVIE